MRAVGQKKKGSMYSYMSFSITKISSFSSRKEDSNEDFVMRHRNGAPVGSCLVFLWLEGGGPLFGLKVERISTWHKAGSSFFVFFFFLLSRSVTLSSLRYNYFRSSFCDSYFLFISLSLFLVLKSLAKWSLRTQTIRKLPKLSFLFVIETKHLL